MSASPRVIPCLSSAILCFITGSWRDGPQLLVSLAALPHPTKDHERSDLIIKVQLTYKIIREFQGYNIVTPHLYPFHIYITSDSLVPICHRSDPGSPFRGRGICFRDSSHPLSFLAQARMGSVARPSLRSHWGRGHY